MIPRSVIDLINEALSTITSDAQEKLLKALKKVDYSDVTKAREVIVQLMETLCDSYCNTSAVLAADMYDEMRQAHIGKPLGATAYVTRDPKATEGAVRAFIQDIVDGKPVEAFEDKLTRRVAYEIKTSYARCEAENAIHDRERPMFARIPRGATTCTFCLMLAGRGFEYASRESAGAITKYHDDCDCQIVCSWEKHPAVEGYTPEEYNDMVYKQNKDAYDKWSKSDHSKHKENQKARGRNRWEDGKNIGHSRYEVKDSAFTFRDFNDVKEYLYQASSQSDLEYRYSQLGRVYGFRSDQMQSKALKNAVKHAQKQFD